MAKFSKKVMGKEVGDASIYAEPHDMKGKPLGIFGRTLSPGVNPPSKVTRDPNTLSADQVTPSSGSMRVSAGNPARDDVKTTGMKQRGSGAATKGFTSRGPMA
jgi:hypothetical protein